MIRYFWKMYLASIFFMFFMFSGNVFDLLFTALVFSLILKIVIDFVIIKLNKELRRL